MYILIDHTGLKFGFDYGDNIKNNNPLVKDIQGDEICHRIILESITKNDLDVISLEAGSPVIMYEHNKNQNIIKSETDFSKWSRDIHLIKSYKQDNIPTDIATIFKSVIDSFLPLIKNTSINQDIDDVGFWLYSAGRNANDWENQFKNGFMSINYDVPDDLSEFENKQDLIDSKDDYGIKDGSMNTIRALWDFNKEINIGDVVISKKGRSKYLGYGIVTSNYLFDENTIEYKHKRNVKWIKKGEWDADGKLPVKTLTNITQYSDYVEKLKSLLGISFKEGDSTSDDFNLDKLLENVFIHTSDFQNIIDILSTKKI